MIGLLTLAIVTLSIAAGWLIVFDRLALGWALLVPMVLASLLLSRLTRVSIGAGSSPLVLPHGGMLPEGRSACADGL